MPATRSTETFERCRPRRFVGSSTSTCRRGARDSRVPSGHDPGRRRRHRHGELDRRPDSDDAVRRLLGVEARHGRARRAAARRGRRASTCGCRSCVLVASKPTSSRTSRFDVARHRPETTRTIPIEVVSRAIIDAVERNRFMTYVPRYYGLLAWLAGGAPVRIQAALASAAGVAGRSRLRPVARARARSMTSQRRCPPPRVQLPVCGSRTRHYCSKAAGALSHLPRLRADLSASAAEPGRDGRPGRTTSTPPARTATTSSRGR